MNQNFNESPYGKIPLGFDFEDLKEKGELPSRAEKRQLMLLSTVVGLCVIFFIRIQNIIPNILIRLGLGSVYLSNELAQVAIDSLISIFCILIPFVIGGFFCKRISPSTDILPFKKPNSKNLFYLAIAMGGLALMVSNYITSAFVFFMEEVGVKFTSPEMEGFTGGTALFLMYIIRGALVPALVEEFALRGVVMQPLRKYGDKFAILISSLIFAVMHGNMIQAPFAFILGCAMGYLVIITDTLWTGVAIHFFNNSFSIVMSTIASKLDYEVYFKVFSLSSAVILTIGGLATAIFLSRRKKYPYTDSRGGITRRAKKDYFKSALKIYMLNPAILVSLGMLIYSMREYVSLGG
ncbi:MAG: type II CAAX endopeptidase family protein [Acutalibacteraceae bacterium]|jgi:membrane protease YdiL (CAAX protease family)